MTDPFRSAKRRIVRAQEHLTDLEKRWNAFEAIRPFARVVELNAEGTREIHKIKPQGEMPEVLAERVAEVADALRSALDQACYAVGKAWRGGDPRNTFFPFANTAAEVETQLTKGRSKDIHPFVADYIKRCNPHKAGNDRLWALNKIRNSSQHKLVQPIGITPDSFFSHEISDVEFESVPPRWNAKNNEMVLFSVERGAAYKYEAHMNFSIAFGEIDVIAEEPIFEALPWYIRIVELIVQGIETESRRIGLIP